MTQLAKNTTDSPQVIDDDGHILGGGEWGEVDAGSDRVQVLVDAGLIVLGDGPKSASSAAAGEPAGDGTPASTAGSKASAASKEKS